MKKLSKKKARALAGDGPVRYERNRLVNTIPYQSHPFKRVNRKSTFGLLPRHQAFEKNLLGCLIRDPKLIIQHDIRGHLFYEERDIAIFNTLLEMLSKKLRVGDLEIWQYLREKGLCEKLNGLCPSGSLFVYLGGLVDNSIMGNTAHEVKKLREIAQKRKLWRQAYRLMKEIEREGALNEI